MKFNKFNLITTILFVVGFVCVLFNFLANWLNFVALALFSVASVMLTVILFFSCKRRNAILSSNNEEIIMELAIENGEETFVPKEKKQGKFKNFIENFRIFSPCIISGFIAIMVIILFIFTLTK